MSPLVYHWPAELDIEDHPLHIGSCTTFRLKPAVALSSHIVTTRNGNDAERFHSEILRQLQELDIQGKPTMGKRRTFSVHKKQIAGYRLFVSGLTAAESITLQEIGLVGRRKMNADSSNRGAVRVVDESLLLAKRPNNFQNPQLEETLRGHTRAVVASFSHIFGSSGPTRLARKWLQFFRIAEREFKSFG